MSDEQNRVTAGAAPGPRRTTFVSFLLDETGSMGAIRDETIDGFNGYVERLRTGGSDIAFSLVTFNSTRTRRRWVAEPIARVSPLTEDDYVPEAMTPLIDAAVKIIRATDDAVAQRADEPNVVVVIQTDGQENVSVEYTRADLAALVKEKTAAGWQFVFLGAGLDAFDVARRAGIDVDARHVVSYGRERSREAFEAIADNVAEYAEHGDASSLRFTVVQRASAGDEHAGAHRERRRPGRSTVGEIDLSG